MELAGMRVGNREIRREIDVGTAVFTGAMQGLEPTIYNALTYHCSNAQAECIY